MPITHMESLNFTGLWAGGNEINCMPRKILEIK